MVKHVNLFGKNHNTLTVKGVNPYGQPDRKKTFFFDGSPTAEIQPFVSEEDFFIILDPTPTQKNRPLYQNGATFIFDAFPLPFSQLAQRTFLCRGRERQGHM